MDRPLRVLQRDRRSGGSLSLGNLLDEYGEEIFTDLLIHYRFNLVEFLQGVVPGSPRTINAMLRHLPEGSSFSAVMSAPDAQEQRLPPEPELQALYDRKFWTGDRQLLAQLINAINTQTRIADQRAGGKLPEFPIVGPAAWSEKPSRKPTSKAAPAASVDDVFNRMMGR